MNGEGGHRQSATGFHILLWRMAGFWACALNGRMGRYSYYQRQAAFESGHFTSSWFVEGNNAFGMHQSQYTQNSSISSPGDEGHMALYPNFGQGWILATPGLGKLIACYRSWKDRISWDEGNVSPGDLSYEDWCRQVAERGYKGGRNATAAQRDSYRRALLAMKDTPGVIGTWFDDDGPNWIKLLVWLVVFGSIAFLTFLLLRRIWRSKLFKWLRKK